MTYFPFYINIDDKRFLIVGGGRIAGEKLSRLKQFTGNITIVAEEFSFDTAGIDIRKKPFAAADLDGFDYCIAATDDCKLNRSIGSLCRERGILVNTVDDESYCDFIFPSIIKEGDLTVSVSTNGSSPAMAALLKKRIREILPDNIDQVAREMKAARSVIRKSVPDQDDRKAVYKQMLKTCLDGGRPDIYFPHRIVIATRGSKLALAQAEIVKKKLACLGMESELRIIRTQGDKEQKKSLAKIGGRGVFVKEIERALLSGEADIAVHSGKDLPFELAAGLTIAATPEAESDRDVMLSVTDDPVRIGTGSLRRIMQLKAVFPKAEFIPIRGNVDTRLEKLRSGQVDAIVLARAGLNRLSIDTGDLIVREFTDRECIPAATQGIIAVECRRDRRDLLNLLSLIDDSKVHRRFNGERACVRALGADCTFAAAARYYQCGDKDLPLHETLKEGEYLMPVMYQGMSHIFKGDVYSFDRDMSFETVRRIFHTGAQRKRGKVYIAGAGPDYELLTLRTRQLIGSCDDIVYDDLIDPSVLSLARPDAAFHPVGKRLGSHKASQQQINDFLVTLAVSGRQVLRLKGGDPFVFGRGAEEAQALGGAGIEYELVPGITSAVAVPEHFGIPVTSRGVASGFIVETGHAAELHRDCLSRVYLMGITRLAQIVDELTSEGFSADTPVAVMSRGFKRDETIIRGRLSDIVEKAADAPMPGIIFVGEGAGFSLSAHKRESVTVTGTRSFVARAERILTDRGFRVKPLPHLITETNGEDLPDSFETGSILVFTSANGVDSFFKAYGKDLRTLASLRFAVIGPGTGDELRKRGFSYDYMPENYTSEALAELLIEKTGDERIYLLRADNASDTLPALLDSAHKKVENICVYRTTVDQRLIASYDPDTDYILFGSANGVRSYIEAGGKTSNTRVVCIGELTARAYGKKCIVAKRPDLYSLADELEAAVRNE